MQLECMQTLSVSRVLSTLYYPSALIPRKVAMLHGRENLKKELEIKSFATSIFRTNNGTQPDDPFHPSKKGSDEETEVAVPQSILIKGEKSRDMFGISPIQVDKRIVVSDR